MLESKAVILEQKKLDKLGAGLQISYCSGSCKEDAERAEPSLVGILFPLKGNKELIKKLERQGWYCDRREKVNGSFRQKMCKEIHYQKYAIYRTSIGLLAKEYYDTPADLKRAGLVYIKPEYLPVTVNRVGGYTSFIEEYDKKDGFVEIIRVLEDEEPLTREQRYPKNSEKFKLGWIDRAGNTYACGFEGHRYAAEAICEELGISTYDAERELEKQGWVKLLRPAPYTWENRDEAIPYFNMYDSEAGKYISTKQYEKLCELGYEDYKYLIYWMRDSEYL